MPPPGNGFFEGKRFPLRRKGASFRMTDLLTALAEQPLREFSEGEAILKQDECTGLLYVLVSGAVEVVKDGVAVTRTKEPGAVFGDLSALLGVPHTAEVRAMEPSRCRVVEDPLAFLEANPVATLQLCRLLARRLDGVNRYLVDIKRQFEGHDHLAMVDGMLDLLMHRQPRERVRPRASSLRDPELAD